MTTRPAAAPEPEEPTLIFQWERRSRAYWRLAYLIGASLLAHALSFYVFQVAYTPTGSQAPPPAQAMFVPLDHPDEPASDREKIRSLGQWLAMTDPALVSRPAMPSAASEIAALNFSYVPSYEGVPPRFKSLEPASSETLVPTPPRPRPLGPVPESVLPAPGTAPSPLRGGGRTTRVVLSGDLTALVPSPLPPVRWTVARGSKPLDPSVFLVGVRAEGGSPYLFRQGESGDKETDDFARDYVAALSFVVVATDSVDVVWGWAEFDWGTDVYR